MSSQPTSPESEQVALAQAGDAMAFERLVGPNREALRAYAQRLVVDPDDAEDLTQAALLQAFEKLDSFRGDAKFRTWLFSIVSRKCLDHLRRKRRWPVEAQSLAARKHEQTPELLDAIGRAASEPGFRYEYREHIAYCFACVGRSLEPEQNAALLLREVFEMTNPEAAKALGLSLSTFRHRLASARATMQERFEGLCALVGKQGVCWQCAGLREAVIPEGQRGPEVQPIATDAHGAEEKLRRRLTIVREAKFGQPAHASALSSYLVRYMSESFG